MNLEQIYNFILRIFDGPYDEQINCTMINAEMNSFILFLKMEGYINFSEDDYRIEFTDKGYDILFKLNDGTNIAKLETFVELKKLAEKFYGNRQTLGGCK
jgi:hypothetical protein